MNSIGSAQERGVKKGAQSDWSPQSPQVPRLKSCLICRTRKVRCDKRSPCSNCRRANIACVAPPTDRAPRWARRLEQLTAGEALVKKASASHEADVGVDKVMSRIRKLEALVQELNAQLEQARSAAAPASSGGSEVNSPDNVPHDQNVGSRGHSPSSTDTRGVSKDFGRLVLQDASHSRYISSGFWSRINDEIDGLKVDTGKLADDETDSSVDDNVLQAKTPSTQEDERTPSERHAFLFRHGLTSVVPSLRDLHPLPSQIPFLLDVFSENVNIIVQILHMPAVTKMVRDFRDSGMKECTPSNEALMFSIYFAAIISMEDDDVMTNFEVSKSDLSLKYRLGLEQALAKADFLNNPDIILVQAFTIFLCLLRRHDSSRYGFMMTGLVIRMAQYLGLQRDGSHFAHLTPYEIEMRRAVWWAICALDLRASEDQATDLSIPGESFDTKIPLNLNDADISPSTCQMPIERDGITDKSIARIFYGMSHIMRQMTFAIGKDGILSLQDQDQLLGQIYQKFEDGYCRYSIESGNIIYWVGVTIARLTVAKMRLIVYLPVLFSTPSEEFSEELRSKLLVSAIEVAEYNHALNSEQKGRRWRWVYQSYTHWHCIVFLLLEVSRRNWSPLVERAWVALHSSWLIPAQTSIDRGLRIWIPLKRLMTKARKHRQAEINRLRANPQAAIELEQEGQSLYLPSSPELFHEGIDAETFRDRWRRLVNISEGDVDDIRRFPETGAKLDPSNALPSKFIQPHNPGFSNSSAIFEQAQLDTNGQPAGFDSKPHDLIAENGAPRIVPFVSSESDSISNSGTTFDPLADLTAEWYDEQTLNTDFSSWPSYDSSNGIPTNSSMGVSDVDMGLDDGVNWYNWVASVRPF